MKKSLITIVAIFIVSIASAQTLEQFINKYAALQTATINALQKTIDSLKTAQVVAQPPSTTNYNVPNAQEKMWSYMYTAYGSIKDANGSVITIPELLNGKYPIKYRGIPNPTITGLSPTMFDALTLEFLNRPNTNYASDLFTTIKPPYTVLVIGRKAFGQTYEALLPGDASGNYLAFGGSGIRIINNGYNVPNSTIPDDYRMTAFQINVNTNNTADYYAEGVKIGSASFVGSDINNVLKSYNGVGVTTNSSDWHFAALYIKAGGFTDSDYTTTYKSIASKWGIGSYLNEIILNRIAWVRHGDARKADTYYDFNVQYKSIPAGLIPTDPIKWKVEWYYQTNNFATQITFSTKPIITTADFPANYVNMDGFSIGLRLTPLDTNGHYGIKHNGKNGDYTRAEMW